MCCVITSIKAHILYVIPGRFEVQRNESGQIVASIATVSGLDGVAATVSTRFEPGSGQADEHMFAAGTHTADVLRTQGA
jgi:hypothetical protein